MAMRPSPVVALNRAIGVAQHEGPERGLEEIQTIADANRLASYPFYHPAAGEFELRLARGTRPRANTSDQHSPSRATQWSDNSSNSASVPANARRPSM
jgi:predicted RNA polymerase sigma factor